MTTTMMIQDLLYEELILLQDMLMYVDLETTYKVQLDPENKQIFEELYNKVMVSLLRTISTTLTNSIV